MSNVNSSPDVRAKVNGESVSLLGGQIVSIDQSSITDGQITIFIIVVGYEKRDNFAQNAIFLTFFKLLPASRALSFWLGLFALLAIYFIDLIVEATANLPVSRQSEA